MLPSAAIVTSHYYSLSGQPSALKSSDSRTIQVTLLTVLLSFTYFIARKMMFRTRKPSLDFSDIKSLPDFDIAKTEPHGYRPWKAGKYNMTMGIRKMPEEDWLVIDNKYQEEQDLRKLLLETNRDGVMQVLPGAEDACEEALDCIVNFLIKRYPTQFQHPEGKLGYIYNGITNRTFKVNKPYDQHPLEVAAQLMMEDINLLIQGPEQDAQNYYL
jgi:hypothetical protein